MPASRAPRAAGFDHSLEDRWLRDRYIIRAQLTPRKAFRRVLRHTIITSIFVDACGVLSLRALDYDRPDASLLILKLPSGNFVHMHIASGTIPVSSVDVPRCFYHSRGQNRTQHTHCGLWVTLKKFHSSVCVPTRLLRLAKQGLGPESCGELGLYTEPHILVYAGTYIQKKFER